MRSQVGRTFSSLRKSFPNMGEHFPRVGSPLPTWEGIFHVSEIRSQPGRAFSTCQKSAPNMGGHFPLVGNRFRMSMNSLVPRYTPLLLSTDLAADETIGLTIAMFVSR